MPRRPEEILRRHHAWEKETDRYDFQWQMRLLQSIWRSAQGMEPGMYRGKLRGARLSMPYAKETLNNYMTPNIKEVVRQEVENPKRSKGKLYARPRIYDNLLSSQPLCFNLFAELTLQLELATLVFRELTSGRMARVTAIDFEYSPGRGDARYTGDRSAFDVYIQYDTPTAGKGFVGIEVKYHEHLDDPVAEHRCRYDEVASHMGCFRATSLSKLQRRPLQQIWRDHLLVGAHQWVDGYDDAFFAFLYPHRNKACVQAISEYRACLNNNHSFCEWTLESLITVLERHSKDPWIRQFRARYIDFSRLPNT